MSPVWIAAQAPAPSATAPPELVLQTGPSGDIKGLAFSADGRLLATAGRDQTLKLWEVSTGLEVRTFALPKRLEDFCLGAGGQVLATAVLDDGGVSLWNTSSGRAQGRLETGDPNVRYVACSPDGRWLASHGGQKGEVKVWDPQSGELVQTLGPSFSGYLAFSPDSLWLAASDEQGPITFWETGSWRVLRKLETARELSDEVRDPGGRNGSAPPAITRSHLAWPNKDGGITVWDIARGSASRTIPGAEDGITAVALSPDGRLLASVTVLGAIKLWDVNSGRELRLLADLKWQSLYRLALSPDGRVLAADLGYQSGAVRLWDTGSGHELHTLQRQSNSVRQISVSSDGRWLSADPRRSEVLLQQIALDRKEEHVQIWDLATGQTASRLPKLPIYSPGLDRWVQTSYGSQLVQYWDAGTGQLLESVEAPYGLEGQDRVVLSPDGLRLASATGSGVKLWELPTWRELLTVHQPQKTQSGDDVDKTVPRRVWFSPKGTWVASGDAGHTFLWDSMNGKKLLELPPYSEFAFSPDESVLVEALGTSVRLISLPGGSEMETLSAGSGTRGAVSPDGRLAVSVAYREPLTVWDLSTGLTLRTLNFGEGEISNEMVAFSPNGKLLAVVLDILPKGALEFGPIIAVLETTTWRVLHRLRGHTNSIRSLAFTADGNRLASAGFGGTVRLWEMAGGTELLNVAADFPAAISADGSKLAAPVRKDGAIRIWDARTGRPLINLPLSWSPDALAFNPDGSWLAAGGGNRPKYEVKIWEVGSGTERYSLPLGDDSVDHLLFSPDGKRLTVGARTRIHHLDLLSGKMRQTPFLATALFTLSIGFSPDARWYYTGGDTFRVLQAETGSLVKELEGPLGGASAIAVSSRGILALAGTDLLNSRRSSPFPNRSDSLIRLWDLKARRELRRLSGHSSGVNGLAFTQDGRFLFSAGEDGSIRMWDPETGEMLAVIPHLRNPGEWLVITPDGLFDGSPEAFRRVAWRFAGNQVSTVEPFFNDFYHPGLLGEILAGRRPKAPADLAQLDRRQPGVKLAAGGGQPATRGPAAARTVSLKLEVAEAPADVQRPAGSGARDLRLFRNGSLVKVWRGDVLKGQSKTTLEASVPIVAGTNRFTAYAFNKDNIKSPDSELVVTGAESLRRKGTAYVLAIGINQYANPDYNLNYAVADAQAFADELGRQQKALGNYAAVEVVSLLDADATKTNILQALRRLAGADKGPLPAGAPTALEKLRPAEPEDAVFVYYAGHGTAAGPRFFLIPHDLGYSGSRTDLDEAGLKSVLEHSISDQELERAFEKIDAGRLLLVIDACNSGQALEAEEKRRGPMNSKGLAQLAYEKGMYILTAAQGYQAALEAAQLGHGYLTYALVEEGMKTPAADSSPKDGEVMMREWLDYATLRVPQMQEQGMQDARKLGREVAFVDGEEKVRELAKRSLQRPRVFYRREPEARPLVVARP